MLSWYSVQPCISPATHFPLLLIRMWVEREWLSSELKEASVHLSFDLVGCKPHAALSPHQVLVVGRWRSLYATYRAVSQNQLWGGRILQFDAAVSVRIFFSSTSLTEEAGSEVCRQSAAAVTATVTQSFCKHVN